MERNIFKKIEVPESIFWQSTQSGWVLTDLAATIEFGKRLNQVLEDSNLLLLKGTLGSGKTSLVKGIAKDLGIIEPITSPTFALSQHYLTGKRALVHLDLYRLEDINAAYELFIQEEEEAKSLKALMVIEWPCRLGRTFNDAWCANLKYSSNERRLIQLFSPTSKDKNSLT
ncbi:tRNA (adenosine(37)-N6)-threonylcarbamoyltransferase complex ATPase subunit type 1 TsaE [Prochlorococcus marinus]|uniref:tRNA threonylcarbamoyladenosine biosynthesis protein TsaE n=1 Tax=Prochlorococcus marinus (strain MIT 9211) TaxID=93059 RepID=A9BD70_PROM4|nr:tRNA (adenosine(37)-N6)-threonylcarbamoyltransferase complex ATPase subunit type 1 TsaE [Prochlorococcus marinus]ABX09683.1 Predicted ATPase or kinase [Prochlorococcus marinus str. MIT 9211]